MNKNAFKDMMLKHRELNKPVESLSSHAVLGDGWRDCKQELPLIDYDLYMIYDVEGSMAFAHYFNKEFKWPVDVVAWMPLPDPPSFA